MAMNLAPVLRQRFFDANGNPLAGGKLYSYQSGTSTPQLTYADSGGTPNLNPVTLDANGEAAVWLDPALSYKFILKTSADVTQWTVDNVIGTLTNNAVSTAAIQDSAVTTAKVAASAVNTAKLADDAVTADKLKDSASVDADRAVTSDHIRDAAITAAKRAASSFSTQDLVNLGLSTSVGSNALTIALKDAGGNDPSSSSPVKLAFRNSTATTGTPVIRSVTSALSLVVGGGSTLGTIAAQPSYLWVYAIDSDGAGAVKLGISSTRFNDGSLQNTTAEGGAGAADSISIIYSDAAYSSKPVRLIGRLAVNQATAGTWATAPTEVVIGAGIEPATTGYTRVPLYAQTLGLQLTGPVPPSVSTGTFPHSICYAFGSIWATCGQVTSVQRFNAETGAAVATIATGTYPASNLLGICASDNSIWAADLASDCIYRINPLTNTVSATIAMGSGAQPRDVCFDGRDIWVTCYGTNVLKKVSPTTDTVTATVSVGTGPYRTCFDGSHIWCGNWTSNNVSKVRISDNAVAATTAVEANPWGMFSDGTYVYVSTYTGNTIKKINAATAAGIVNFAPEAAAGLHNMILIRDELWVTNSSTNNIQVFDVNSGASRRTFSSGGTDPAGLCWDGRNLVWVSNAVSNLLTTFVV